MGILATSYPNKALAPRPRPKHTTAQREQRFVNEYVKDSNGTQAYLRAFPDTSSEKVARTLASRMLTRVGVQALLATRTAKIAEKVDADAAMVLNQLGRIARNDPRKILKRLQEGKTERLNLADLPDDVALAIQDVDVEDDGTIKSIRFASKDSALDKLGKHHKLYTEKYEVTGQITLEMLIDQAGKLKAGDDE